MNSNQKNINQAPNRLTKIHRTSAGRSHGTISVRHKSSGTKKHYRVVDFKQLKMDIPGVVVSIEYSPVHSADLALVKYPDGDWRYVLAASEMKVGSSIVTSQNAPIKPGNRVPLKNIPSGTAIHNIELRPGAGGQTVRSAGTSAAVLSQDEKYTQIKLPSSEVRKVLSECMATIGRVSVLDHNMRPPRRAGIMKYMGKRPTVRGKAMAPNSHPHGGGEGVNPIGLVHPKTPWGKPALGYKTRKRKESDKLIVKRRK
jgi:large subunit ribosomal protein L2